MKTSPKSVRKQNIPWTIPACLLGFALLVAWSAPAQAAGCACSTKEGKAGASGAASCCGGSSAQKSGDATCSCGSAQGQGGHDHANHATIKSPAGRAAKGAQREQDSRQREMPGYAKRVLAALQEGDMAAAEAILESQYMRMKNADGRQTRLAVATGLAKLAADMRDGEQQAARKSAVDRALALADETIGSTVGDVKATALIVKARILKQNKGDEAGIQDLVDAARVIDPGNRNVLSFSRQNSHPARP